MSAATCAVLAQIFPVLLLAVIVEGRAAHRNIARTRLFEILNVAAVYFGIGGLVAVVLGVQFDGLNSFFAVFAWVCFGCVLACALLMLMISIATALASAETVAVEKPVVETRLDFLADFVRGRRSS